MGISNPSDKGTQVSVVLVIGVVPVIVHFRILLVNEIIMVSSVLGWFIDISIIGSTSVICLPGKVFNSVITGIDPDLDHSIFSVIGLVVSTEAVVPLVFVGFVVVSVLRRSSDFIVSLFSLIGILVNLTVRFNFVLDEVHTTVVQAGDWVSLVAGFSLLDSV